MSSPIGAGNERRSGLTDKDALDVLRLLRAIPVERLPYGLRELSDSTLAGDVTHEAMAHLQNFSGVEVAELHGKLDATGNDTRAPGSTRT